MPNQFSTKHYLSYGALLLMFGAGIWLILAAGSRLYVGRQSPDASANAATNTRAAVNQPESARAPAGQMIYTNLRNTLSILLLQIVLIIVAARIAGELFRKLGQPPVLGEIFAGIALGPSLLGLISPGAMAFLFPASSLEILKLLSQIGVALFMFVVGMELNVHHLREKAYAAIMISHASIVVPFFLGAALSLILYGSLAPGNTSFAAFALFMGIAMSITAFPVLARILEDRGLSRTYLGSVAITCAAVDDVSAWCILALVIAIAQTGNVMGSLLTITLALTFISIMLFFVKPQMARLFAERAENRKYGRSLLAVILAFVLGSALLTEVIGIHALFGAFLAGVVMPSTGDFRPWLKEKLDTFSSAVLLPLFFAITGLRMQIALLNNWRSWLICGVIVMVAITGKLGAGMLMARWTGMNWRDSFSLGVLMNTRGLVELIVLNIGYDLGILSAPTFAMMVLMALITTFMTGPLLSLVRSGASEPEAVASAT